MMDKIKIRWKEGMGLFVFLVFSGLYFFSDLGIPDYFAFLDFLNFSDENYWMNLFDAFLEIIFPAPFLVGVFLYSLYKTEKNIKEGNAVFIKILKRSVIIGLLSGFAWGLLTFFPTGYTYRSDNVIVPLFTSSYFWMMPIAPTALAFLFSFIPSLLLRSFYLNQKKFYGANIGFFVFLFLGLFVYQQISLKNCNFNSDEHCLADMDIKANDFSLCDKAKSDNQKNICRKIIERKNNKKETEIDWKTYRNEEYGFEVKYPESWTIDESGKLGTVVIFFNPTADQNQGQSFYTNINVLIRPLKNFGVKNIEEYANLDKNMLLKYFPDVKFYPDEKISLSDGKEALIINLTRMKNNILIHDRHLIVINNDVAYVMAGTTLDSKWDTYINLIDSAFASFKFTK